MRIVYMIVRANRAALCGYALYKGLIEVGGMKGKTVSMMSAAMLCIAVVFAYCIGNRSPPTNQLSPVP